MPDDARSRPTVRPAVPADVPAIARLHAASFPESLASQLGPAWLAATYRRLIADPAARVLVAPGAGFLAARYPAATLERAGEARRAAAGSWPPPARPLAAALVHLLRAGRARSWPIAAARLAIHDRRGGGAPSPPGAAAIEYVAVEADARGRGVGRRLVRAALADPSAADLAWVVGTTADNAAALALYAGEGFAPRERWTGYDGRPYVRLHRPSKRRATGSFNPPVVGCPPGS